MAKKKFIQNVLSAAAVLGIAIKPRLFHKPDLSIFRRYDYAHRGFHNRREGVPENSIPAFQHAIRKGYGITLDVRLSADRVPVVVADSDLNRLCGKNKITERESLAQLQTYSLLDTDENIPTLVEVLNEIDGQVPVIVHLHAKNGNKKKLCRAVTEILDRYDGLFALESVNPGILLWFRRHRSFFIRIQIVDFSHQSGYRLKHRLFDLVTGALLFNILTAPDVINQKTEDRKNPFTWLCRMIYHVQTMEFTIRNMEDYERVRMEGILAIIEDIEP